MQRDRRLLANCRIGVGERPDGLRWLKAVLVYWLQEVGLESATLSVRSRLRPQGVKDEGGEKRRAPPRTPGSRGGRPVTNQKPYVQVANTMGPLLLSPRRRWHCTNFKSRTIQSAVNHHWRWHWHWHWQQPCSQPTLITYLQVTEWHRTSNPYNCSPDTPKEHRHCCPSPCSRRQRR